LSLAWNTHKNGELLRQAEDAGFEVFVTTDQNLKHQQNFSDGKITIIVLSTTSWPRIKNATYAVIETIELTEPGDYVELAIP